MPAKEQPTLTLAQSNKRAIPQPLRFYDPELQEAWNADPFDPERLEKARQKASELHHAYLKHLQRLSPRLSKKTYQRFSDPRLPLFDSDLVEFAFGDLLGARLNTQRRTRPQLAIRALFRSFDEKTLHELKYRPVESLNANIPLERWFDWGDGRRRIDHLLADELTDAGGSQMQHTYLFASGTLISIRFGTVTWERTRIGQK
jgi:hypothetical protein